ncbi:MAG TPA: peptidylprolyl isomerase [Gemmataceae bacterium]|jgi:cyclophilin family peptidyl-prolyl cis-trans isomerase
MKRRLSLLAVTLGLLALASCAENSAAVADAKKPVVVIETSMGAIKVELDAEKAPITVKNFLQYVDDKFYDGTIFHRVIENFMIQGGGFEEGLSQAKTEKEITAKEKKTRDPIKNEGKNGLMNKRGTIAMARTNRLDTATAQFFINVKDNGGLDNPRSPYCVFGKVIDGMDVVDKIKKVETKALIPDVFEDVPVKDVVIKSIRRLDPSK